MNRFQISTFGAIAIVFAVIGVDNTIFTGVGSRDAMAAGWLILAMVDILWVLYFTSEEDSLTLHIFNSMGTGGLTPPSRRRRTIRAQPSGRDMAANGGYATNYGSGGGIGSHDAVPYDGKMMGSPIGGGAGIRSQNSFAGAQSMDGGAARSIGGGTGAGSIGAPAGETRSIGGGELSPASPLMGGGNAGVGAGGGPPGGAVDSNLGPDSYSYKAKALYACGSFVVHCCILFSNFELQIPLHLTTRTKYHSQRAKFLTSLTNRGNGGKQRKQMGQ